MFVFKRKFKRILHRIFGMGVTRIRVVIEVN